MRRAWARLGALLAAVVDWRFFKPAVFLACLAPAGLVAHELAEIFLWDRPAALGADPTKLLLHQTGQDAILLLFLALSVTPVRRLSGFPINRLQRVRRMLGVWAFAYAAMHVSLYLTLEQLCYSWETCQVEDIWKDVIRRPFIMAGLAAFVPLLLLAITSTDGWVRRLRRNWQRLHRLAYVAAAAAVVHFIWIQKSDISEPLRWLYWLLVLFGARVYLSIQKRRRVADPAVTS